MNNKNDYLNVKALILYRLLIFLQLELKTYLYLFGILKYGHGSQTRDRDPKQGRACF